MLSSVAPAKTTRRPGRSPCSRASRVAPRPSQTPGRSPPGKTGWRSTAPVATYAVRNAGIADKTPPAFTDALRQGRTPSPVDVATVLDSVTSRRVTALVVDDQAKGGVFDEITAAARAAALPIITVSAGLPDGMSYLQWQRATVDRFAAALNGSP